MRTATIAWLLTVLAVARIARGDNSEQQTIDGTWLPAMAELAGTPWPEQVLKTIVLKLERGKYEVSVAGQMDRGECVCDGSTMPKRMTIRGNEGPNSGKTFLCIYDCDGETLRVCYDLSGQQFPSEFATKKGTQLYLVT